MQLLSKHSETTVWNLHVKHNLKLFFFCPNTASRDVNYSQWWSQTKVQVKVEQLMNHEVYKVHVIEQQRKREKRDFKKWNL